MPKTKSFLNPKVEAVFKNYPPRMRKKLMLLRQLIFDLAAEIKEVGELEEALKWGEPAYVTSQSKSGSTIRIDVKKANPAKYAIYFHCQTNLVDTFRKLYPDEFTYEGSRAIVFHRDDEVPLGELSHCISLALTYHLNKKPLSHNKSF